MHSPAQKKKPHAKTPEYRAAALKYSAFVLILGLILGGILAFLIHRAETRELSPAEQKAVDVHESSKESTP